MEDSLQEPEISKRRSKRSRAAPVTRSDRNGGESPSEAEEREEEVRQRTKRSRVPESASVAPQKSGHALIDYIKGNGKEIHLIVKLWVEHYEKDSKPAMVDLLTMLFQACGAKFAIKEELLDKTNVVDVVVALVNLARNGDVEEPQFAKKKNFRNFRDNLLLFWDNLVVECRNGPLFDKVLFDKCVEYIIALSCHPRIYRQVASLMGLQLVTSFISVAKALGAQRETTQRQLNAQKKKRAKGKESPLESFNERLSMTHDKILVLEEMMRKIFKELFVHRYRDIDPYIRMSCIESLGVWILSYPSLFLQDLYLTYLGWTLNDKNAGVRKASVLALQNLYDVGDNVPTLGLFTERFSVRMIELADDIDVSVAVCAIGLVKQLLRHQLLPDEDLGSLYDLLIDDRADIRRAIGELVYEHWIAQKFNSSQACNDSSEVHLSRMLQILRKFSTDQIRSKYVIDAVWEHMRAMKDWKCIISMLSDENPMIELTDDDATNLEIFEGIRRDITVVMMKNYPLLLRKFMADKAKIPSLVEIIVHMNLELYSYKRQEQSFKTFLQLAKEAFFKHGEKDTLRSCVKAINFCSSESKGELKDYARNKLKNLEDELIAKLKYAMTEAEDGDEYSLLINLKRLYELQLTKPVSIEGLYKRFVQMLHSFRDTDEEVASFMLLNMYLHVAWSLHSVVNGEIVSKDSLSALLMRRKVLFEELEYFLGTSSEGEEDNKCGNQLACRVCIILAESWRLFRKSVFSSTKLEDLGYSPDKSVVDNFWRLCEEQLNISDEPEEDANKEYIEESNRDAVMIAAVKLVVYDIVPKEDLCPDIVSHYVMHGPSVSEIVKHLVILIKETDKNVPGTFLEALKRAYDRHLNDCSRNDESVTGRSFLECKDLAVRLSGTFAGAARKKYRSDILKIIQDGIEYAFKDAPKHLSFLEGVVLHFVSKLLTPDILEILKDVQSRTKSINTDEDPSGWRPYHAFVNSLTEKYAKHEEGKKEEAAGKRRGGPRKRRHTEGKKLFDESSGEEGAISVSDQEDGREEEEDDNHAPLIQSIRPSSKLRSLKVS